MDTGLFHRDQVLAQDILAAPESRSTKRFLNDGNSDDEDGAMGGFCVEVLGPGGELLQAEGDAAQFILERQEWEQHAKRPEAPSLSPVHQPARMAALARVWQLYKDAGGGQLPQNLAAEVLRALEESGVPEGPLHGLMRQFSEQRPQPRRVVVVLTHQAVDGLSMGSLGCSSKGSAVFRAVMEALGVPACDPTLVYLPLVPTAPQQAPGARAPPGYRDAALDSPGAVEAIRADLGTALLALQLCQQIPAATLLLTPLGAPALFGRELRDEEMYAANPVPLVPELQQWLPPRTVARLALLAPHPTCVASPDFTWMSTLRMFLQQGGTLPPGEGRLRGVLAAFQATLSLQQLLFAVSFCLTMAGRPPQALEHVVYPAVLQLLRAREDSQHGWTASHLCCLAQPDGCFMPGLVQLLLTRQRQLGIAYRLSKAGAQHRQRRSNEASDPPTACAPLKEQLQQQQEALDKELAARKKASAARLTDSARAGGLIMVQAADSARSLPCGVARAIGADEELVLADGRSMPAYLLQPDDVLAGRPGRNGVLSEHRLKGVSFLLVHKPLLFKQSYQGEDPISAAAGVGFGVVGTGTVGVKLAYNECNKLPPVMASLGSAEVRRTSDTRKQLQAKLDLSGTFPRPFPGCESGSGALYGPVHGKLVDALYAVYQERERSGRWDVRLPDPEVVKQMSAGDVSRLLGAQIGDGSAHRPELALNTDDQVAHLRWMCDMADKLRMRVAVGDETDNCAKFLFTTNSGARRCTKSRMLDSNGRPTGEAPRNNEQRFNVLNQWFISLSLSFGSSRAFSGLDMARLLSEGPEFLLPMLAYFYAADGSKGNACFSITQGRLCHHGSLALLGSRAGLRCELGGLLHAGVTTLYVTLRGPRMKQLNPLVPLEHKRLSEEELDQAVFTQRDVDLRHYSVERVQGWVLCVALELAGGPAEVRTADGLVLRLG